MGDSKDYYSKKNPLGPYAGAKRPYNPTPETYIEGQSTKKNLAEWTEYSKKHSDDPSITGKKLR